MNLNKDYYRYIERELYNYRNSSKELKEIQDDIINASPSPSGERVQSSTLSDETATKAIRLTSNARLGQLERTIKGIETGIRVLKNDEEQNKLKLLQMKYFDCEYTDKRIAMELNISDKTYYRWKNQIIHLMAIFIGLA